MKHLFPDLSHHRQYRHCSRWRALVTSAALLLLSLLAGCAANPTGGVDFVTMSEGREIELGKELHEEMLKEMPVYDDPELQAYVERVGQKMAENSHRPELEYHFTIIDSPDINAFALPGGYVYINRGLMAYLTNEAQLAAVLGHEIGHVTARHSVRQQSASTAANAASVVAQVAMVMTTGVSMAETTSLLSGALLSGYGREMELEADSLGAEYLFNAGYDPMAMVDVISVLKNHENFTKRTSSNGGGSYHGVFATHPRNDVRLQEVVGKAGQLAEDERVAIDPSEFRQQIDGLLLGPSLQTGTAGDSLNRYYQNLLNYTLVFPEDWNIEETAITATGVAPEQQASLKVEVQRLQQNIDPRLFIRDVLGIDGLQESEAFSRGGLPGYTGIIPDTGQRLAVIYYGPRAFIFTGTFPADHAETDFEAQILASIGTFRPINRNERAYANPPRLVYIQSDGTSWESLAQGSRISQYAEDLLRLYNGDYPTGEPQPGEWIKVAQ